MLVICLLWCDAAQGEVGVAVLYQWTQAAVSRSTSPRSAPAWSPRSAPASSPRSAPASSPLGADGDAEPLDDLRARERREDLAGHEKL